jgi:hypothetical protein
MSVVMRLSAPWPTWGFCLLLALGSLAIGVVTLGLFWLANFLGIPSIESAVTIGLMVWFVVGQLN